jgi:hypothetical protein
MTGAAAALTHECPARLCTGQIDPGMLMCPRHWYQVPKPVRAAVWRAWRRGAGAGTSAHAAAIRLAIAAVNRDVVPASSLNRPARGHALVSQPRAGLDSPAMTRRSPTDER